MIDIDNLKNENIVVEKRLTAEILTPMRMYGWRKIKTNNQKPVRAELRIPALTRLLRYWWRSLQQDLSLEELLEKEQNFFGRTDGSQETMSLLLLVLEIPLVNLRNKKPIVPRKNGILTFALKEEKEFTIVFKVLKKNEKFLQDYYWYARLMMMLSGFGQRAKRGAGAVQLIDSHWETIDEFQNELKKMLINLQKDHFFEFPNDGCMLKSKRIESSFPVLNHVWIGKSYIKANKCCHDIIEAGNFANPANGKQLLGKNRKNHQTSQLHATVRKIGNYYYPIISEVITPIDLKRRRYLETRAKFLTYLGVNL